MTQEELVKEFIEENGSITSMQAFRMLGVTRLSAVVYNLRNKGYKITCEDTKAKNRFGKKVHFGTYFFEE